MRPGTGSAPPAALATPSVMQAWRSGWSWEQAGGVAARPACSCHLSGSSRARACTAARGTRQKRAPRADARPAARHSLCPLGRSGTHAGPMALQTPPRACLQLAEAAVPARAQREQARAAERAARARAAAGLGGRGPVALRQALPRRRARVQHLCAGGLSRCRGQCHPTLSCARALRHAI